MRIGICTFHRALNVGAVLQAYALKQVLSGWGHEVSFVDNNRIGASNGHQILEAGKVRKFRRFACREFASSRMLPELIVYGSDQIWNENIAGTERFLGDDQELSGVQKVVYGASLGDAGVSESWQAKLKAAAVNFAAVSLREPYEDHTVVVDPSLLVDAESWRKLAVRPKEKDYVLIYVLFVTPEVIARYRALREEGKRVKVLSMYPFGSQFVKPWIMYNFGPCEWLGWMMGADSVVTDSFHGVAFARMFGKPYEVIRGNPRISNLESLIQAGKLGGEIERSRQWLRDSL